MDLEQVARELYALPPGEFTAARNGRASEARLAGDRDLAGEIRRLRRPTRGAWLANAVVRARPDLADQLAELGEAMRQAQEQLAGDELRRLSPRRASLLQELTRAARQVGRDANEPVSGEMERELQATVEAALADPAAGEAVRAGGLVTALSYSGLGAGPAHPASRRPPPAVQDGPGREDDAVPRRQAKLDKARETLAAAETEAEQARKAAEGAELAAQATAGDRSRLDRRAAELEAELAALRAGAGEVARVAAERAREASAAARTLRLAEERLARARRELERAEAG